MSQPVHVVGLGDDFAPVARLVDADGTGYAQQIGESWWLGGNFLLEFMGVRSGPKPFAPGLNSAEIEKIDNQWTLVSVARIDFAFGQIAVPEKPAGPWLVFGHITLSSDQSGAALSFPLAGLDLVGGPWIPDKNSIRYPTANGPRTADLDPISIPADVYVRRTLTGLSANLGFLHSDVILDHVQSVTLHIPPGATVEFRFWGDPEQDPLANQLPLAINRSEETDSPPNPLKITFEAAAALQIESALTHPGDQTSILADQLLGGQGWLTASRFRPEANRETVTLNRLLGADDAVIAKLYTDPERLRFHLPLKSPTANAPDEACAQFVYRDGTVDGEPAHARRAEIYYGLQIQGLGHHRAATPTSLARLDANWLRFVLDADAKTPRVQVRAGQDRIVLPPTELERTNQLAVVSRLVPKPDDPGKTDGTRTLKIPYAGVLLNLRTEGSKPPTTFTLDTKTLGVTMSRLEVDVLAAGSAARAAGTSAALVSGSDDYQRIRFAPLDLNPVPFDITAKGIFPVNGKAWLKDFGPVTASLALYDTPGLSLDIPGRAIRQKNGTLAFARSAATGMSKVQPRGDALAYSEFAVVLHYPLINGISDWKGSLRDDAIKIDIEIPEPPPPPQPPPAWVIDPSVNDLVLLLQSVDSTDELHGFIDLNMQTGVPLPGKPKDQISEYRWPLAAGLSMILWRKQQPKADGRILTDAYCDDIAKLRPAPAGETVFVRMALDFSNQQSVTPDKFGWPQADWVSWKNANKVDQPPQMAALWPRLFGSGAARLDPSDALWRGLFLRRFPLALSQSPNPGDTGPIANFFRTINDALLLDYGWKDETGTTWFASLVLPNGAYPLLSNAFISITLTEFFCAGSPAMPGFAQAKVSITLLAVNDDQQNPVKIDGRFIFDLTKGFTFDYIDFVVESGKFATKSVPGFAEIEVVRARSDLRRLALELRLWPDDFLLSIFPGLTGRTAGVDDFLEASLSIDLQGAGDFDVALVLPASKQTPLFGWWPATLQGLRFKITASPLHAPPLATYTYDLTFHCSISLGIGGLEAVGVDLILERTGQDPWKLHIEPVSFSADIALPSFSVSGQLHWQTDDDPVDSVLPASANLAVEARKRVFWGGLALESALVSASLSVRIGGSGTVPYWVASLAVDKTINLGIARLKDPIVLLASHADYFADGDGGLADLLQQADTSLFNNSFKRSSVPIGGYQDATLRQWIASDRNWRPSNSVGLLVAASAGLQFHEKLAPAPSGDDRRTTIVLSDGGFAAIEATLDLLGLGYQKFGIAIDFSKKFLAASFQGRKFKYPPPPGTEEFHVNPGEVAIRIGIGGQERLLLSIGWPIVGLDFGHEDWSKAVEVHWDGAFPLNTFSGGVLAEYATETGPSGPRKILRLGFALRAGWTKEYSQEIISSDLASVSATLSVFIGGIIYFRFSWDGTQRLELLTVHVDEHLENACALVVQQARSLLLSRAARQSPEDEQIRVLHGIIAADFEAMLTEDLGIISVLFAEVEGSASASLLGVTIASVHIRARATFFACGDTRRGVVRVYAEVGFQVSVRIGCVTASGSATIRIELIHRAECNAMLGPTVPLTALAGPALGLTQ